MTTDLEEQLRRAFEHRAQQTAVSSDLDPDQNASMQRSATSVRSWLPYAGVAAAGVLVVVGMVALGAVRTDQTSPTEQTPTVQSTAPSTAPATPTSAAPTAVATGAVLGISLDDWIGTVAVDAGTRSWTVLDTTQLPADVELIDEAGGVLLSPPLDGGGSNTDADFAGMTETYQYGATVLANGFELNVTVTSSAFGPCSALLDAMETGPSTTDGTPITSTSTGTVVDINGRRAVIDGSLVCWTVEPGVVASVDATGSSDAAAAAADLARRIEFTEVDQLPQPTALVNGDAAPASGDFAGTLNAVPWLATVEPSSLRTMWVYADGQAVGGFENDRLSQPTDIPAATGELSLAGVPGAGALVFGYVAPEVVAVRVTSSSDEVAMLAVLQRENESFLTVPIPEGVVVRTLEFVRADESVYAVAEVGPVPANLEGTYGGLLTIKRAPATPD
jgi:hypothetical protein